MKRALSVSVLLGLLTLSLGCDSPSPVAPIEAPAVAPQEPAPTPAVPEPAPVEPAVEPSIPPAGSKTTVPPFPAAGAAAASTDDQRQARALNSQGLAAHRREAWPDAIRLYTDALTADPAFVLARYNLACALSRSGDADGALAQLRQLRDADCESCRSQLAYAARDKDFERLWNDPRFLAVVQRETPTPEADTPTTPPVAAPEIDPTEPAEDPEVDPLDDGSDDTPAATDEPSAAVEIQRFDLPPDQPVGILAATLTTAIDSERLPAEPRDAFTTSESPVTFWMTVRNTTDAAVPLTVVWKREGVEKSRSQLNIGRSKDGWKSWALRPINRWDAGSWSVEVQDAAGAVLQTFPFRVEEDG